MTIGAAPMCMGCRHLIREGTSLRCAAFPDGILEAILDSRLDHRQPIEGDHGIQFEADPFHPLPDGYLERLFGEQ